MTVVKQRELDSSDNDSISSNEGDSPKAGVVRDATKRVVDLYGRAKVYSPTLKYSLEAVECRIPTPLLDKMSAASEPVIDKLEMQIEMIKERVISPVKQTYQTSRESVITKSNSLLQFRSNFAQSALVQLNRSLTQIREFSATTGKDMIKVDLIAYSLEALENANIAAKPYYEPVNVQLYAAIERVNAAVASLQKLMAEAQTESIERVNAYREELQERLNQAVRCAHELSLTSVAYLKTKLGSLHDQIPAKYQPTTMYGRLPVSAKESVNFILGSPKLFVTVKEKADLDLSNKTMTNIVNLLTAVREVFGQFVEDFKGKKDN